MEGGVGLHDGWEDICHRDDDGQIGGLFSNAVQMGRVSTGMGQTTLGASLSGLVRLVSRAENLVQD